MTTAHGLAERVPTWRARSQHGRVGLRRSQGSQNAELAVFRNRQDGPRRIVVLSNAYSAGVKQSGAWRPFDELPTSSTTLSRSLLQPETPTMTAPLRWHDNTKPTTSSPATRTSSSGTIKFRPPSPLQRSKTCSAVDGTHKRNASEPAIEIDAARRDSQHNASAITRGSTWAHHSISALMPCVIFAVGLVVARR